MIWKAGLELGGVLYWIAGCFLILINNILLFILKKNKTYPRIEFFGKMAYPRIRIGPIPIRISVSVLLSKYVAELFLILIIFDISSEL